MTELEDRIPIFKFAVTFATALTAGAHLYHSRVIGNAMMHSTASEAATLFQSVAEYSQKFMMSMTLPALFGSFGLAVLTGSAAWAVPGVALACMVPITSFFMNGAYDVLMASESKCVNDGDKRVSEAVVRWCYWQQFRVGASVLAAAATIFLLTPANEYV